MRILKVSAAVLTIIFGCMLASIYTAPETTLHAIINASRLYSGLEKKSVNISEDLQYVYLEGGEADSKNEALMLLHGFGANKDNFTNISKQLTKNYRVIIPDHIGFGESSHPVDADYSPKAQAERLHRLSAKLGIKKIHLAGSSMGGHIAMTYAALYPEETASLWLLDPGGVWSAPDSELKKVAVATGKNPLQPKTLEEYANIPEWVMHRPPSFPVPFLKVMAAERIKNTVIEDRVFKQILDDSVEERVRDLKIPTLIVWGEKDRVLNVATSEILRKLMPLSKVIIMPDVGHLPMLEKPSEAASDYIKFRNSL